MDQIREGDNVIAFNDRAWCEYGKDYENNSVFFQMAEVVRIYREPSRPLVDGVPYVIQQLADLRWLGSRLVSRGHFVSGLKRIETS